MQRCDGKSCYCDSNELKRMSMVSHACIAIGNTSVMFVLLGVMRTHATIQRLCECRTGNGQTVPKWRQPWRQLLEADSYVWGM